MLLRRCVCLLIASALLAAPVTEVQAVALSSLVRTDAKTISRVDFLSWTYTALRVSKGDPTCALPFKRTARAQRGVLCSANDKGLLQIFGTPSNTTLRKPITRGEALRILTILTNFKEKEDVTEFKDIQTSDETQAVMNAVTLKWMVPVRSTHFGIADPLSGAEVLSLLQAVTGDTDDTTTITVSIPDRTNSIDIPKAELIDAVWEVVRREYLKSDSINDEEVAYRALEAMLDALDDPYTTFLRPARASDFQGQIKGSFTGIGAHVIEKEGLVTIVSPITGSPAEKAGLKAGDIILLVDGKNLEGLTLEQAISLIRGERGTVVKLHIRRSGNEMDINVTRDLITVPEIDVQWHGSVAVLKLVQFGETTDTEIRSVAIKILEKQPTGLILDLRNNGGGLLTAAEEVASIFLPLGTSYAMVKSKLRERSEDTQSPAVLPASLKVVVLVNEASASASEIVAGALQDLKRATIVGTKTFGKGTVQSVITFTTGEALKVTTAEWHTPLGRSIEETGVVPDVIVEKTEERDDQLLKALTLFR